ncbi:MAG: S8 family serine peptidase, partial [Verrucomicrobia bacterium]|nr:S8 family serine peptidase [Verrucomicrobiota bacterium]
MKSRSFVRCASSLFMLLATLSAPGALTGQKTVHLRNATLPNEATPSVSLSQHPTNGLFLIQFHSAPSLQEREQLRGLGIESLQYVPEDAFIAKFTNASPSAIAQMSFVNWVGDYRPQYKIHRALIGGLNTNRPVAVLLHSSATPAQIFAVRRMLLSPRQSEPQSFGTIIRGMIKPARLAALAQSEAVLWIESAPPMKLNDEVSSKIVAGDGGVNQLYTQSLGFDGAGVKISVADTGLDAGSAATMHPDLLSRTPAFFFYGALTDASDEHSHGTHCAGIIAGNGATGEIDDNGFLFGLGVAPGAQIIAQRIFDGVGGYEAPPSYETLTRDAKSAGADIGSNSWGDDTQGRYDISAMEFDGLVRDANALTPGDQPYILEFSAGNAGPGEQTIGSPAVGKNVIATGASENDRTDLLIYSEGPETMADFSSRGPCEDGRIKPDVVAPGTWISSAKSSVAPDDNSWSPISDNYLYVGGTSQAGPHVSGAAAVFVQYYRTTHTNTTPSPALVKAALINSAVDLDDSFGTTAVPNNDEGWGRADLTELIGSTRAFSYLDQTVLLAHDQTFTQSVIVASSSEPLKITLTYTDVPGFPGAIPALVNDLDLEVTGPDGRVYRGNQFNDTGESVPNAVASDAVNNVEAVHLFEPLPGEYIIRVHAHNVVQDSRHDTAGIDQDFALVTSGDLPEPGTGLVILDRGHYRAPSTIQITVLDGDLAGNASANVLVRSSTETNGEPRVLFAANATGKFTNSIATTTGAAANDGSLQIANVDTIEVRYFDASSGSNRSAFAVADFVPPVISVVGSTNAFGLRIISWQTDEPSTSIVRYDTNTSLTLSITNLDLTANHSVALTGLIVNKWYKYAVISTDEAGNTTTNDNSPTYFSFQALPTATLLLVDSYNEPFYGSPPLSGYTSALDQLGISYDPWDVAALGASPTLTNLQPYRAVIWRVPDLSGVWSAGERSAISNYVKGGGGLFVASMEVLSRLDEVSASSFWRNVLHVESYVADDTVSQIIGTTGAPVGNGVNSILDYSVYDTLWDELIQLGFMTSGNISDTIIPGTNAVSVLTDSGATVGLRWPKTGVIGPGRVVFFPFPLDAVPTGNPDGDERAHLLRNVIQFLVPGVNVLGTVSFDSPAYTVPSLATVE